MGYIGAAHHHAYQDSPTPGGGGPQSFVQHQQHRQHRGYERLQHDSHGQFPLQATPQTDAGYFSPAAKPSGYVSVGPAAPEIGRHKRDGGSKFKRFWKSQWAMMICFLFGAACAAGHHVFYFTLDGKVATDQLVMQRYGTLLAFGAKAGLSAAVIIAYHQRVWVTVRKRLMSVAALDSLFSLTSSLAAFFSWEMIKVSKIAALLGLFVWIAPLTVVLTANTLQVELKPIHEKSMCPGIRSLNFTFEETDEWRNPTKVGKYFEVPIPFWNTTRRADDGDDDDWFDYYTGPGSVLEQTLTVGAFMGETLMRKNAQLETCGLGWNCSFELKFIAPAYKCTELASGVGSNPSNLTQESGSIAPPFNTDVLVPRGVNTYYGFTGGGEYSTTQINDVLPGGIPKGNRPDPKNLGAFRTEPIIWMGYAVRADPSKPLPKTRDSPDWESAFIPKIFGCENYEASYTVLFNYTSGSQTTNVTSLEYIRPVINTTYLPLVESQDDTADNITAIPESNYIFPRDKKRYRLTAAYHSLGLIARSFLNGTVSINKRDANSVPLVNTDAVQTTLLDLEANYFPHQNLQGQIQKFYTDIILSMLSNPQFSSVVWATKPDQQSGLGHTLQELQDRNDLKYPCEKSQRANVYKYHFRDLWIVYGISIIMALCGVIAGLFAVRENGGVTRDTGFSDIVAATRGKGLDKVNWQGGSQGMEVNKEVREMKMGYGFVEGHGTAQAGRLGVVGIRDDLKYGFGFEDDLTRVKRKGNVVKRLSSSTFSLRGE
ncbi:hypothetical protein QBC38DRAFT_357179 [Podospora fimiseda]|uniref:Uncharacterized protein n=1 Tax=Podospora fimiseda TaxID=252190 RepID=A0AAN7BVE2_9PEZI|nr:hypothetical protein QBC38DRAFT_357179 [Podospora fimiseda]